jgi:hypothetical protein
MKTAILSLTLLLASNFSNAAGDTTLEDLVGRYALQRQIQGYCYPEANIKPESFTGTTGPGLGIYGELGRGEIYFQFSDINLGRITTPVKDMNSDEIREYYIHEAEVKGGHISGETIRKDKYGNTLYQTAIAGRLSGDKVSFRVQTFSQITECEYKKVN